MSSCARTFAWLALSATALGQDGALRPLDAVSASGRFAAHVRKVEGQEHVDDVLARWILNVDFVDRDGRAMTTWTSSFAPRPGARQHFVGDDGAAFVEVDPSASSAREVVRVWRRDDVTFALGVDELSLPRALDPWLARASIAWTESLQGPVSELQLELADGGLRRVDLASGVVSTTSELQSELAVGPQVANELRALTEPGYVEGFDAPDRVYWGEPVEIVVRGAHPTPNWHFAGFDAQWIGGAEPYLALTPLSLPPPSDRPQVQVLEDFRVTATIAGLPPGRHVVRVRGRGDPRDEPATIRVLPARPWLELEVVRERIVRVYATGVAAVESVRPDSTPRYVVLDDGERARLSNAFAALAQRARSVEPCTYRLSWSVDGRRLEARYEADDLEPAAREVVAVLGTVAR